MEQTIEQLKQIIDNYYKTELPRLKKYFEKFRYENERYNFPDLVSELYIHSIENIEKIAPILIKNHYHYYATKYIFNQRMWGNTKYKQNTQIKDCGSDIIETLEITSENDYEHDEELLQKEMDTNIKLAKIKVIYDKLPLHEKILFDKYYNRQMSMRMIGRETGVSQTAIYYMIKRIRKQIRNCKL
jgi:RNA polymerase sigma factor (sigma-70 family)